MALKTVTTYTASDGRIFTDKDAAEAYEKELEIAESCPNVIGSLRLDIDELKSHITELKREIAALRLNRNTCTWPTTVLNERKDDYKQGRDGFQPLPAMFQSPEGLKVYPAVNDTANG